MIIPFAVEQFQDNGEVSFSSFPEDQFSILWFHANGHGYSVVGIITTEWDLNLPDACYDICVFQWNLQNFIAVDNGRLGVSACAVASGQRCFELEVCWSFCCSTTRVQETNMFTVHSFEYGLGDSNGHFVLQAVNDDSSS